MSTNKRADSESYRKAFDILQNLEQGDAAIGIQTSWRGALARKQVAKQREVIQSSISAPVISNEEEASEVRDMQKLPPLSQPASSLPPLDKVKTDNSGERETGPSKKKIANDIATSPEENSVNCQAEAEAPSPAEELEQLSEPEDDEEEKPPEQDLEESMREVNAAIVEQAASAKVSASAEDAAPMWPAHDETFQLPNSAAWPDLTRSDADVYDWVHDNGAVLTRLVTWNLMASPPPPEDVINRDVIPRNRFHIYAIGTEECERTIAQSAINTNKDQWEEYLKGALGPMYHPVKSHTLQAIHLMVFVHKAILPLVSDIRSGAVATGLGNRLGNKGAVGIRMTVGNSKILIVNAHLAAHQNAVKERNAQFARIEKELAQLIRHQDGGSGQDSLSASQSVGKDGIDFRDVSDRFFFMGDLNYRVRGTRDMVEQLINKCMVEVMLNNDQLSWSMRRGLLPSYLQESEIMFKPTYKFNKSSDVYDTSKKRRTPGWTDRILFGSDGLQCIHYGAVMDIRTSDHRPVYANFSVDLDLATCEKPQFDEGGSHGHTLEFTSDSQVCNIM